ncbi:hypothetical protein BBO99_00005750 [Phytophthora kernoviae]|uniref:Transmembrane protein 230 n=2 Tax=Phytophthora kernoviae TaxID=325452 RepID=A0A3R7J9D0_9STRA|nr:hypothetical protein G195_006764 [Phytophthora kernoviae 00238/432]KAG2525095.1 hypothetical protein JM18_004773 [Phytophthora kernoviae]KAG2527844.1 hypothetical protein JM16_002981 [Phytophthora kernoviae]RLN43962.1 hypothetical protein BBI17_003376 [Phytophthora kernoviae]RLN78759.1 hypothetical protein BBO99_00005750 [Phytophthora kernoviae]
MAKDVNHHRVTNDAQVIKAVDEAQFTALSKENAVRVASPEQEFRRRTFPIRTGLAAIGLFALGSILIWVSTRIGLDSEKRGLSFLILGLIAFIPGSYASYQLYGAWKGWKGYDYSQIPSYDD